MRATILARRLLCVPGLNSKVRWPVQRSTRTRLFVVLLMVCLVGPGLVMTYIVSADVDHPARWAVLAWMVGVTAILIALVAAVFAGGSLRDRVLVRGDAVADAIRRGRERSKATATYEQSPPLFRPTYPRPRGAISVDLDALARLHQAGELTDQEFSRAKEKLLQA